jgi:hypothetical protein
MNIPASRQRKFHEKEVSLIEEAIRMSGLHPESVPVVWDTHSVLIGKVVEVQAVLFDCRGLLDTPCWIVSRTAMPEPPEACSCGALARESCSGTYGSLKAAVATALAEIVRKRVMSALPESSDPILKARTAEPIHAGCSDFISHCIYKEK